MGFFRSFDYISFVCIICLLSIGLLTIYSVTLNDGKTIQDNILNKQIISALLGIALYFVFSRIDYSHLKSFSGLIYVISLLLLIFTFVWGLETRGSTRWVELGYFRMQASEFVKLGVIIVLAKSFSSRPAKELKNLIAPTVLTVIPLYLIYKQPDLGSAIVLAAVFLGLVFVAGLKFRYLLTVTVLLVFLAPLAWGVLKDYQRQRITTFLNPESDPLGSGYNVIQSMIAVGSGQISGKGFGRGTQSHLNFLPEQHTDFIFATLSEELGLVGSLALFIIAAALIFRQIYISNKISDPFGSLLILGVIIQIAVQLFINVGMNVGLVPVTGITLPLVSYGGSSLVSLMISLGILQSVYRFGQKVDSQTI